MTMRTRSSAGDEVPEWSHCSGYSTTDLETLGVVVGRIHFISPIYFCLLQRHYIDMYMIKMITLAVRSSSSNEYTISVCICLLIHFC